MYTMYHPHKEVEKDLTRDIFSLRSLLQIRFYSLVRKFLNIWKVSEFEGINDWTDFHNRKFSNRYYLMSFQFNSLFGRYKCVTDIISCTRSFRFYSGNEISSTKFANSFNDIDFNDTTSQTIVLAKNLSTYLTISNFWKSWMEQFLIR